MELLTYKDLPRLEHSCFEFEPILKRESFTVSNLIMATKEKLYDFFNTFIDNSV